MIPTNQRVSCDGNSDDGSRFCCSGTRLVLFSLAERQRVVIASLPVDLLIGVVSLKTPMAMWYVRRIDVWRTVIAPRSFALPPRSVTQADAQAWWNRETLCPCLALGNRRLSRR